MGSDPKLVYDLTRNGDFETSFDNPFSTSHRGDDYSLSNVLSKGSARINSAEPYFSKKMERNCSILSVKSKSSYPRSSPTLASRNTRIIMENSDASFRIISPTSVRGNPNAIPEKSDSYFPVTSPLFVRGNPSAIPEQSNSYFPITPRAYAQGNPYSDSSFPILGKSDAPFPVTSPAFARRNPTTIIGNSDASFSIASLAFVRGNPTYIPEKSGSYFPTTPLEYARENSNFDASFPTISPPSAKGNHNTMLDKSDASSPITSPVFGRRNPTISLAFARGHPNIMPVKSHAIRPTSGLNIGGAGDEYQQLEEQIRLRFCTPKKCNDSLSLSGQHGVGTSLKNHLEGVTSSTLQQNQTFTSFGLSSHIGKDWYAERAAAYFQETLPILKRKRGDDDENSVNKKPFLSSSQLLFDFQAGNDDHSVKKKPFLPSLQPAMYKTGRNLFKDEKLSALSMMSARMLKLKTSIDTVTSGAQTRTRKDKGKSVLLNEESCKANTYAKGKNIQAAVSTGFSIEEMKRLLEIDGNASEDYLSGALAYDNIVDTSPKLLENEERMSQKLQENEEEFHSRIFKDCPGLSYVPISEPQNLVHAAMDSSKNPNVSVSNDDEFALPPGEENPNLNTSDSIFNFHQRLNSMQKDNVNPNLFNDMMETGCERKEGENPVSGRGELLYTGNLGDLGFASKWMNDPPIKSDCGWMIDSVQPTNPFVNVERNF